MNVYNALTLGYYLDLYKVGIFRGGINLAQDISVHFEVTAFLVIIMRIFILR